MRPVHRVPKGTVVRFEERSRRRHSIFSVLTISVLFGARMMPWDSGEVWKKVLGSYLRLLRAGFQPFKEFESCETHLFDAFQ